MRIELGQDEIVQLVHDYLIDMGVNVEGKDVEIVLAVRRTPTQTIVAEIDINRPRPEAEADQAGTPAPKTRAPRQPRKPATPVELVTRPFPEVSNGADSAMVPAWEEADTVPPQPQEMNLFAAATPTAPAPEAEPAAADKVSLFV